TAIDYSAPLDPVTLPVGNYSVSKELAAHQATLEEYADHYIARFRQEGSPCYIDPDNFAPQFDFDCETTCEECREALGTEMEFVTSHLKGIYHIEDSDTTTLVVTYSGGQYNVSVTPNEDANFGIPIPEDEAEGHAYR